MNLCASLMICIQHFNYGRDIGHYHNTDVIADWLCSILQHLAYTKMRASKCVQFDCKYSGLIKFYTYID